jgi:hypothetical protein
MTTQNKTFTLQETCGETACQLTVLKLQVLESVFFFWIHYIQNPFAGIYSTSSSVQIAYIIINPLLKQRIGLL